MLLFISIVEILNTWNHFFFTPQSTLALCIFRVLVGFLMMIESLQWLFYFQKYISADGYLSIPVFTALVKSQRFSLLSYLPATNKAVQFVILLQFCSGLGLVLGVLPQVAAFLCFLTTVSLHNRNPFVVDSGDAIRRYFCLILVFAPTHTQLSVLDVNHLIIPEAKGWLWTLILLQLFMANIYLKNVLFKLSGNSWREGIATKEIFNIRIWNRFPIPAYLDKAWFYQLTTYGTLFIETLLFTAIWIEEFRPYVLIAGILFHIGLWVFLRIGFFQITIICGLLSFIKSEEYLVFFRWAGLF